VVSKDTGAGGATTADVVVADATQGDVAADAVAPDAGSGGATGTGGAGGAAGTGGAGIEAGLGGASGAGGAGGATATGGHSDAGVGGAVQSDANTGDSSDAQADVATEADAQIPLPPLELCGFLDSVYGLTTPAGCETQTTTLCDDRAGSWIDAFWGSWASNNDCRIRGTLSSLTDVAPDYQYTTWQGDVNTWTFFFFGCPLDQTPLSSQFAMIPRARWDWPYTTADLQAFGETFIAQARLALGDWSSDFSADDLVKIQARMDYLINAYEHDRSSSSGYSASTCPSPDGGSDASPE